METPAPRRYEAAELLFLAKSPLVCKPEGLPPIEEWMGPIPAVRPANARARTEGDNITGNHEDVPKSMPSNRRPSFLESRGLTRSSIPEDIILGPPKMSFASSSSARTPSGKFDSDPLHLHNASITSPTFDDDRESPRFDRFRFERGNRGGDKDKEKDRGTDRGNHIKRGFRDETDGWTNVSRQPRKSFGAEDGDRFRRGEKEKKENPWDKDRPPKYENFGRERDREHRPRGKRDESSWLLDDNRDRDRGDRHRDNDHYGRDNNRYGNRNEKDPEWMDAGPAGDSKTAHSAEDFQRWKERMKASNPPPEEKKRIDLPMNGIFQAEASPKQPKDVKIEKPEPVLVIEVPVTAPATAPAVVENGVDRFFGLWSSSGAPKNPESDILSNSRPEPKTVGRSSRFTSFFGPQEPAPPHQPETPISPKVPSPAVESSSEDKEGFDRILKMLGGTNIGSARSTPGPSQLASRAPQPSISPAFSGLVSPHVPPPPQHPQQQQQQVPISSTRETNSDFFMRLMQQSHQPPQGPPPPPSLHNHYGGPSQMPPLPPISTSPHDSYLRSKSSVSPPFDDPAITGYRHRSSRESSPIVSRGPQIMDQHGPPHGWTPHQSQQPPMPQTHRQIAPPPGFGRPQLHQGPPPPPPFLGPPSGVNGPPMPFQLGPIPPNLPPNLPPNFPPPFFGMNGPPLHMNGPPPPLNGPPPPQGYHIQFGNHHHHQEPIMGLHGPPFGFPHDGVKSPPHQHGPGL